MTSDRSSTAISRARIHHFSAVSRLLEPRPPALKDARSRCGRRAFEFGAASRISTCALGKRMHALRHVRARPMVWVRGVAKDQLEKGSERGPGITKGPIMSQPKGGTGWSYGPWVVRPAVAAARYWDVAPARAGSSVRHVEFRVDAAAGFGAPGGRVLTRQTARSTDLVETSRWAGGVSTCRRRGMSTT